MSFVQRAIDVTIALGPNSNPDGTANFGPGTGNTVTLSGLRCSANIDMIGGDGMPTANIRVFGMTADQMNKLTVLGKPLEYFRDNIITVSAGDAVSGMAQVFTGSFYAAYQDFLSAPDVSFMIQALVGAPGSMKPVPPSSYKGSASVATVMGDLASQMGLTLENSGVTGQISNPYFPGTARDQAIAAAKAADIHIHFDGDPPDGKLCIWPKTGSRSGMVPEIGPASGLLGYPQYADGGISVRSIFNRDLRMGGQFNLVTSITPAAGTWTIRKLTHELESQTPNGAWFTLIEGYRTDGPGVNSTADQGNDDGGE